MDLCVYRISTVFVFNRAAGSRADLALAALPPAGVLVFGTQKVLCFVLESDLAMTHSFCLGLSLAMVQSHSMVSPMLATLFSPSNAVFTR